MTRRKKGEPKMLDEAPQPFDIETPDALEQDQAPDPPAEETTNAEELVVASDSDEEVPFTVNEWKGLPNYNCKKCNYATVKGEQAIRDHYFNTHVVGQVRRSGIVGPDGRPIFVTGG